MAAQKGAIVQANPVIAHMGKTRAQIRLHAVKAMEVALAIVKQ